MKGLRGRHTFWYLCVNGILIKGNTTSNQNDCSSFIIFLRNTNLISLVDIKFRHFFWHSFSQVELRHILTAHTDASTYFFYFYLFIYFFWLMQYWTSLSRACIFIIFVSDGKFDNSIGVRKRTDWNLPRT